jgi:hypothetical protein
MNVYRAKSKHLLSQTYSISFCKKYPRRMPIWPLKKTTRFIYMACSPTFLEMIVTPCKTSQHSQHHIWFHFVVIFHVFWKRRLSPFDAIFICLLLCVSMWLYDTGRLPFYTLIFYCQTNLESVIINSSIKILVLSDVLSEPSLLCKLLLWHFKSAHIKSEADEPRLSPPTHTYTQIGSTLHHLHTAQKFSLK